MLTLPDRSTVKGKRNYVILALVHGYVWSADSRQHFFCAGVRFASCTSRAASLRLRPRAKPFI